MSRGTSTATTTLVKIAALTGIFLLNLCNGVEWYYGNLSTYVNSYFRFAIDDAAPRISPDWLLSTFIVSYVFGILTLDFLAGKVDIRVVQLIAIVSFTLGQFVTYFSVQHSVVLVLITLMFCGGYTSGVVCIVCLKYASDLLPNHVGLATSIVSTPFGLGAVFYNYAITSYINPDNLTPGAHTASRVYFAQTKLLENVPSVFIVLGISTAAVQIPGYLLEQLPLIYLNRTDKPSPSDAKEHNGMDLKVNVSTNETLYQSAADVVGDSTFHDSPFHPEDGNASYKQESEQLTNLNLKPSEVLRTKSMYQLILASSAFTFCVVLILNFYKAFGQLWIKDDNFLGMVGSVSAVTSTLFRMAFGIAADRFGFKNSLIFAFSVNTILLPWWFITPRLNRWLYFICCQGLIGAQSSIFVLIPMATRNLYGPKYYATNYGLVSVAMVITSLVCPILFSSLQLNYGWFSMVIVGIVYCFLGFSSFLIFMPAD